MLTSSERQFVQSWREQREGPRWKYYLQYTIAWATVIFLSLFFIIKLIISQRDMGGWMSFYIVLSVAVLLAIGITHFTYTINEKKLNRILQREEKVK